MPPTMPALLTRPRDLAVAPVGWAARGVGPAARAADWVGPADRAADWVVPEAG